MRLPCWLMHRIRLKVIPAILVSPDCLRRAWYTDLIFLLRHTIWNPLLHLDHVTQDLAFFFSVVDFNGMFVKAWVLKERTFLSLQLFPHTFRFASSSLPRYTNVSRKPNANLWEFTLPTGKILSFLHQEWVSPCHWIPSNHTFFAFIILFQCQFSIISWCIHLYRGQSMFLQVRPLKASS